jgi:multidrug efflux pump
MNVSEPFIRRPVGTSLLAAGVLLVGAVAYRFLPVAPLPKSDYATISVNASLPGVDPATAATALAAPLERRLGQIPGVSEITSNSSLGGAGITVQFELSRDVNSAARDVQAAINSAAGELPPGMPNPPSYRKYNPSDSPILTLALTSESLPLSQVYNVADQTLAQRIAQVDGVSQVDINGGAKSAVRVQVNPAALASMGLSIEDVRTALARANVNSPRGSLDGDGQSYVIASNGQLNAAEDYRSIIVAQRNGVPIRLSDIGQVKDSVENTRSYGWYNGKPAVLLFIRKQPDANVIETVDGIKALLPQLERWLPPAVKLSILSDRTQTIRASVSDVQHTLLLTMALVIMVMFLFLRRFWPTFISGITMPLALAGTFGVMYLLDYSLNNLSLMALTISTGFVVDDAIVVIENIVRRLEKGDSPLEAALEGSRQIGFTIISITISLVAVFIPILFMGGLPGRLCHEFAVTLSVAVLVSGVVSLTLTPMLCAQFLRPEKEGSRGWFYETTERGFDAMLRAYDRGLTWVLRHEWLMLAVTGCTIAAAVWLYTVVPKGNLFPQQDTGFMMGISEAAQDISSAAMAEKQREVARIVMEDPAVEALGSFTGGGSQNSGRMFVTLKAWGEARKEPIDAVIGRLRGKLSRLVGVTLFFQPMQDIRVGGRTGRAQFQYTLQDQNLETLNEWAPKLVAKLNSMSEIKDASSDQQYRGLQTDVVIDRDAAARAGIRPQAVDSTLYSAFGQRQVSVIYTSSNQYRVVLEADPQFISDPTALDKVYVRSDAGKLVPLSAIAHYESTNTALSVNHQGQFPAVTISFNLAPGTSLGQASDLIDRAARELGLPASITGKFAGTAKVAQDALANQPMLIATALVVVYIVLGMLYESLIHPLTILSTLPSAGLGALLAMLYVGDELSVVSTIGIILLIGIVKKNAIMMVDFALDAERHQGMSPEESIHQACLVRFRPIMMTTMAALFGALPLAFGTGTGSELRRPLGVAIVGGLIVSQMLTLFTTPVIYLFLDQLRQPWAKREKTSPSAASAAPLADAS